MPPALQRKLSRARTFEPNACDLRHQKTVSGCPFRCVRCDTTTRLAAVRITGYRIEGRVFLLNDTRRLMRAAELESNQKREALFSEPAREELAPVLRRRTR